MGWPVQVVDSTGSTNADLVARAAAGEQGPTVLVARAQTAGRGRLGRSWQSPPGASLAMSVLWRPVPPRTAWTWLPMVVGLGVLDALAQLGVDAARLKWPNDVVVPVSPGPDDPATGPGEGTPDGALTGLAKLAGILLEVAPGPAGPQAVAGVGVNLRPAATGPGVRAAALTDLLPGRRDGDGPDLDAVAPVLAGALRGRLDRWDRAADADAGRLRQEYREACSTLGRRVRVTTPSGDVTGEAVDVAEDGALVLRGPVGPVRVSAGDVEHVR
ncbi:biotin--[acetyl-CoA-carboxylase] ligase [Jannaschia sp. R86511]|uniref:biotin--[acetyl-CoA-carboxylase] ligase n=1 Tax=Jannaschia sp. R86511 TaxID=3093853 RepID=UPI0036D30378